MQQGANSATTPAMVAAMTEPPKKMLLSKGHLDFPRASVATAGETAHGSAERTTYREFITWRGDAPPVGYGLYGRWRGRCQASWNSSLLWVDVHRLYPFRVALLAFQKFLVRVAKPPAGERAARREEAAEKQKIRRGTHKPDTRLPISYAAGIA